MRRSIKKAVAFTLAAVTMFANLSITSPVKAAEYGEVKEVLPNEYDRYWEFGDGAMFYDVVDLSKTNDETDYYVSDVVIVDKNGGKSTLNIKNADGSYKYKFASPVIGGAMGFFRDNDTLALYFEDGTWLGADKEYNNIQQIYNGNYLVNQGNEYSIVDKTGKVIAKKIADIEEYEEIDYLFEFGDYIVVQISTWGGGRSVYRLNILDKNYKEVKISGFSLDGMACDVNGDTLLVVRDDTVVYSYDKNFKQKDFVYKRDIVENPSASATNEKVLVEYYIDNVFTVSNYDIFVIPVLMTSVLVISERLCKCHNKNVEKKHLKMHNLIKNNFKY